MNGKNKRENLVGRGNNTCKDPEALGQDGTNLLPALKELSSNGEEKNNETGDYHTCCKCTNKDDKNID